MMLTKRIKLALTILALITLALSMTAPRCKVDTDRLVSPKVEEYPPRMELPTMEIPRIYPTAEIPRIYPTAEIPRIYPTMEIPRVHPTAEIPRSVLERRKINVSPECWQSTRQPDDDCPTPTRIPSSPP